MHPKTDSEIKAIRESGQMLAQVRDLVAKNIVVGVTTKELADIARKELLALGGEPAFYGYMGFPDVICISVNEQVVHGIPSGYEVREHDLVSIDYGVKYKGMITDSAVTVIAGNGDHPGRLRKLVSATKESLDAGIDQIKAGARVGDISAAIEQRLKRDGLGIVRDLVGHGVGHEVHEEPEIPNYGKAGRGELFKEHMTIAVEPMATLGKDEVFLEPDGWTITTRDKSLSAHFEHTILVTGDGCEILTLSQE